MTDPQPPEEDIAPLLRMGLEDETIRTAAPMADDDATVMTSAPRPSFVKRGEGEAAGDMIGPYRLIEVLGEGGFGIVWRAEQREPILREVALKVIKAGMDSREIITRF
ncbi:MAG: hypothetical protein IPK32_25255 [Verrucomicrobiaceae bacterium]|nr:hypothetical protein [Verrucomicrobiaceae bacterium]